MSQVITHIPQALGITQHLHTPWRQRGGGDRTPEQELKTLLGKLCQETHLSWSKALLIALFHLRIRPHQGYTILSGRLFHFNYLSYSTPFSMILLWSFADCKEVECQELLEKLIVQNGKIAQTH